MTFTTNADDNRTFQAWVAKVENTKSKLDTSTYEALAAPSQNIAESCYAHVDPSLFDFIIDKYMQGSSPTEMK